MNYVIKGSVYLIVSLAFLEIIYFTYLNPYFKSESLTEISKALVLIDTEDGEQVRIEDNWPRAPETVSACNHFTCFDVHICDAHFDTIKIYIYPIKKYVDSNNQAISIPHSEEYWQLLNAIMQSEYYSSDASKACVFLPSLDTLSQSILRINETSKILASLPYWNGDGRNHLIFNMLPGSFPDYNRLEVNIGKAMIAGGGFDTWSFRPNFDVPIPVYSSLSATYNFNKEFLIRKKRRWILIAPQINLLDDRSREILESLENLHGDIFLSLDSVCDSNGNLSNVRCNKRRRIQKKYPKILEQSKYCLIMKTVFLGQPLLSDALMTGCVPLILMDNYVLPLEDKIDWKMISVRIRENAINRILSILQSISEDRLLEIREQGMLIWKKYFSSMKAIALSTLKIINSRLYPQSLISRLEWNKPLISKYYKPLSLINSKLYSSSINGFTAVILTFDRLDSLYQIIHRVVQSRSCVKVLVIWNNQNKNAPPPENWPKINVPLKILVTNQNKLSNRFYPYDDIETNAILAIDDDIIMLTPDEVEFGFQVWREFPDRIVGFPSRVHRWDNKTKSWRYESEWTNDVSMVLTGAAFYHKYYNYLYTYEMPEIIRRRVDEKMNCEDIAMNFLVSNATGKAPIKVTPRKKFKCPECTNVAMLSDDVVRHLNERSKCVNEFAEIYRKMPLKTVEFRADPVLFKDNLPEKLKKFYHIGSL